MINFQYNVTNNQILILRGLVGCNFDLHGCVAKVNPFHLGCFIPGVKRLIRDGFVIHRDKEKPGDPPPHYVVTDKGRMLLKIVEIETEEFLEKIKFRPEPKKSVPSGKNGRGKRRAS